jgi:hypothetical protein
MTGRAGAEYATSLGFRRLLVAAAILVTGGV